MQIYIYENKEYELEVYFKLSKKIKNKDELIIILKGINNVTDIIIHNSKSIKIYLE